MTNRALLMANDFGSRRLGRNPKAVRVRLSHLLECRAGNPIRLRYTEWIHPVLRTIRAGLGACTIVFDADDGVIRNRTWLTATTRLLYEQLHLSLFLVDTSICDYAWIL